MYEIRYWVIIVNATLKCFFASLHNVLLSHSYNFKFQNNDAKEGCLICTYYLYTFKLYYLYIFVLELSLLERLMDTNDLYKKDPVTRKYNSKYLTKLVQNFRSHEHILTVPNDMFYDNDLQVSTKPINYFNNFV